MKKLAQLRVEDVKLPTNYSLAEQGVTQGLVADFATCRQRFLFRVNGWRAEDEDSDALFFGSLCHHVLEQFYITKAKYPSLLVHKWIADYAAKKRPECDEVLLLKAEALLVVYMEIYVGDRSKFLPIRTEEIFETLFEGTNCRGRKDLVYQLIKFRKKWMMEHKTKSRIDHDYLGYQLSHDIQNLFYDFSEIEEHGDPFIGINYNILKRPAQRPRKGETAKQFLQRLKEEIREAPGEYFYRYEVTFTPQDRARFKRDLQEKLFEMREYLAGRLRHYRNEAACQTPYRCKFLKACTSGYMTGYSQSKIIFPELEDD